MTAAPVFAFAVKHKANDYSRTINHRTRGGAIAEYLREVRDCWPDVKYTDLRARKLGEPVTSEAFERNALYRGMPDLKCGQRVNVRTGRGPVPGVIVGHNSSANFDVLFDDDTMFKGATLNVHPMELELAQVKDAHAS